MVFRRTNSIGDGITDNHSGAMFNRKGLAILPSPKLTDNHVNAFLAASEALVSRVNVRVATP